MREEEREGSPAMAKDSGEGSGAAVGMDGGVMGIGGGGSTTAGAATDCSGGAVASLAGASDLTTRLARAAGVHLWKAGFTVRDALFDDAQ